MLDNNLWDKERGKYNIKANIPMEEVSTLEIEEKVQNEFIFFSSNFFLIIYLFYSIQVQSSTNPLKKQEGTTLKPM